jgi:hypothetical protein
VDSVPFTISGVHPLDLAKVEGAARLEDDALVLEFQTVDTLVGMVKSELEEVRLRLQDLEWVSHRRGWFKDALVITARSMRTLEAVPGAKGVEVTLRCKRKHRKAAASVVAEARLRIGDRQLAGLSRDAGKALKP